MEPNSAQLESGLRNKSLLEGAEEVVETPVQEEIATAIIVIGKGILQGSVQTEMTGSLQTVKEEKGSGREGDQEIESTADQKGERGRHAALPRMMMTAAVLREEIVREEGSPSGTKRKKKTREKRNLEDATAVQVRD
jgi:hypothetical protein